MTLISTTSTSSAGLVHKGAHSVGPRAFVRSRLIPAAASLVLASCGGNDLATGESATTAEAACNALLNKQFEGATITKAALVPAAGSVPEACVVRGELPKELAFEVRMPTTWNNRVLFMGGGGFDGIIYETAYSPGVAEKGYATIATNHGHDAAKHPQGSFALDAQMLEDYAYAAVPKVLAWGCGQILGLIYAAIPRLCRYSMGLREPSETLIRFALYQRIYESTTSMN